MKENILHKEVKRKLAILDKAHQKQVKQNIAKKILNGSRYRYYDNRTLDSVAKVLSKNRSFNCSDDRIDKMRETRNKLKAIENRPIPSDNFGENYAKYVHEHQEVLTENLMALLNCTETKAKHIIARNIDYTHIKIKEKEDEKHICLDPIFRHQQSD